MPASSGSHGLTACASACAPCESVRKKTVAHGRAYVSKIENGPARPPARPALARNHTRITPGTRKESRQECDSGPLGPRSVNRHHHHPPRPFTCACVRVCEPWGARGGGGVARVGVYGYKSQAILKPGTHPHAPAPTVTPYDRLYGPQSDDLYLA